MTRSELALGSATFLAVIASGFLSETWLDRRFAAAEASGNLATKDAPAGSTETGAPGTSSACVDKDGTWKNWPYPNVPMLGPKCADQ